ncbi:MAG: DUF3147 family protein [Solirubrobacterales bacterium]
MSEQSWSQPPQESVGTQVEKLRDVRGRDLGVRFLFGAVTSAVAGTLSITIDPIVGGVFLAFPAILAASLTLIAEEEDREEAREDARGATVGALALAAFAAIGVATLTHIAWPLALAAASGGWAVVAIGLYVALWVRPGSG